MKLTAAQMQSWHDDGHLALPGLIPPELVAQEKQRFDYWCANWDAPDAQPLNMQHESGVTPTPSTVRKIHHLEDHDDVFRRHAFFQGLLDVVEQLIGRPFSLYESQAFLKPPAIGSPKPPHQDNAYFNVTPADAVITCWAAVDDATLENGCLQYYPGSHKAGLIEHRWIEGTVHQEPVNFDTSRPTPQQIGAGGVIIHHSLALHMSLENRSSKPRRAFACHYIRDDADLGASPIKKDQMKPARR